METRKILAWALFLLLPSAAGAEMLSLSVRKANVRATPGGAVLWEAYQYTPFRVTDRQGSWVEIEDFEGDPGWVHKSVLGRTPSVIVKTARANLRENPSASSPVVWVLEKGYPLRIVKRQAGWYQVADEGDAKGWLHESTVWGFGEEDPLQAAGADQANEGSGDSGPEEQGGPGTEGAQ